MEKAAEAARVLRMENPDALDIERGLFEMGMDSLMSVELKSRLEASFDQPLPSTLTFNYPTVSDLAGYMENNLKALKGESEVAHKPQGSVIPTPVQVDETPLDDMDDLSEDELAELLAKKLGYDS